ncbi:hypothetical protein GCG54_00009867 [Colletotrichum gloeosporioides]|uniref:Uncharacterized protein n=1 Tax=Colletotrichum gloeosporioides TaxID=474922 RepID=A0A8H4CYB7_COLGL|nr:uncharacterized protein GCG54_00009867 [Colletotrichum gloeosporioides]KAF3812182.1 hypothetical protein GCG54_00009867 [Colletotrichum gloeosporioides]
MKPNRHSGRGLGVLATLIVLFSTIHSATAVECWGGLSEYPNVFVINIGRSHSTVGAAWPGLRRIPDGNTSLCHAMENSGMQALIHYQSGRPSQTTQLYLISFYLDRNQVYGVLYLIQGTVCPEKRFRY